jgi:hypothetical protein
LAVAPIVAQSLLSRQESPSSVPLTEAAVGSDAEGIKPIERVKASVLPSRPIADPRTFCKARYPLDYHMRGVCERVQGEARYTATTFQIDDDVGVLCAKRYPDDWSMFVTCAKSQMEEKLPPQRKPERPDYDIRKKCEKEWPHDYHMEEHCVERQREAKAQAGSWIDRRIGTYCTQEWPSDWNMFMHCVNQQTKAQSRLR